MTAFGQDLLGKGQVQGRVNLQWALGRNLDVSALAALKDTRALQQVSLGKVKHPIFHQVSLPVLPAGSTGRVEVEGCCGFSVPLLWANFGPPEFLFSSNTEHRVVVLFCHKIQCPLKEFSLDKGTRALNQGNDIDFGPCGQPLLHSKNGRGLRLGILSRPVEHLHTRVCVGTCGYVWVVSAHPERVKLGQLHHRTKRPGQERFVGEQGKVFERNSLTAAPG